MPDVKSPGRTVARKPPRPRGGSRDNRRSGSSRGLNNSSGNNPSSSGSKVAGQRDHIIRVTVLGLAGVVVNRTAHVGNGSDPSSNGNAVTRALSPSRNKKKGKKEVNIENAKVVHPSCIPADPSNLKAIVAFSRNRKVNGISPPSLSLAPSPTNHIVMAPPAITSSSDNGNNADNGKAPSVYTTTTHQQDEPAYDRYIAVWGHVDPPEDEDHNVIHFETILHRAMHNNGENDSCNGNLDMEDNASLGGASIASSAFAPKSFEVTVALGDETTRGKAAYTVGVATLAITGEECLKDGIAKVMDLPVLSLEQARPVGMGNGVKVMQPWYPVIAMGEPGDEQDTKSDGGLSDVSNIISDSDVSAGKLTVKPKKKKGFSRLFGGGKKKKEPIQNEASTANNKHRKPKPNAMQNVLSTAEEKDAFGKIFGIDSSDAVLRISVEVFEKGSELERMINQRKNEAKLLKKQQSPTKSRGSAKSKKKKSPQRESSTNASISNSRSIALMEFSDDDSFTDDPRDSRRQGESYDYSYYSVGDTNTADFTRYDELSKQNYKGKSVLHTFLKACGPFAEKQEEACATYIDELGGESNDDDTNSLDENRRRRHRRMKNRYRNNEKSPRNVSEFPINSLRSDSRSSASHTNTNSRTTLSETITYEDENIGTLSETISESYNSISKNLSRKGKVIRTIHEAFQCANPRLQKEDFDLTRFDNNVDKEELPSIIMGSEGDQESVGDLTENTYEYGEENLGVKTTELIPKVTPKIVLANKGKALTGRVFLPTAFGGDGLCISSGHRLVSKEDLLCSGAKKKTDYERIFFHEQKDLDPVMTDRAKRATAPDGDPEDKDFVNSELDEAIHSQATEKRGSEDNYFKQYDALMKKEKDRKQNEIPASQHNGPVSAVYKVYSDQPVSTASSTYGSDNESKELMLVRTSTEEEAEANADDKYGGLGAGKAMAHSIKPSAKPQGILKK